VLYQKKEERGFYGIIDESRSRGLSPFPMIVAISIMIYNNIIVILVVKVICSLSPGGLRLVEPTPWRGEGWGEGDNVHPACPVQCFTYFTGAEYDIVRVMQV